MDYRELVNLGLSEKEAKVYLAALELGKSPVQKIAQKAEVNRATTYVILESLMKKGLVSSFMEGKKQYFVAEDPEKLNLLFREQELALQRKLENFQKLLPELKASRKLDKGRPTVKYYEGLRGLRSMIEDFLSLGNSKELLMFYSVDLVNKFFTPSEKEKAKNERLKKKIKTKVIYNYDKGELETTKDGERFKVSSKEFPITCDIALYDNKIRIASLGKKISGIMIEDKEIYNTLKTIFNLAWLGIKKGPKPNKP